MVEALTQLSITGSGASYTRIWRCYPQQYTLPYLRTLYITYSSPRHDIYIVIQQRGTAPLPAKLGTPCAGPLELQLVGSDRAEPNCGLENGLWTQICSYSDEFLLSYFPFLIFRFSFKFSFLKYPSTLYLTHTDNTYGRFFQNFSLSNYL